MTNVTPASVRYYLAEYPTWFRPDESKRLREALRVHDDGAPWDWALAYANCDGIFAN